MADFIVIIIVFVLLRSAIRYIIKAKKSGVKCIGCPQAGTCASKCQSENGCNGSSSDCESN